MDIVIKFKCPLSQKMAVCNQQRSFWQRGFVNLQGVRRTKNIHFDITWGIYCAFHKHTNSKVQKPPSQFCFLLPSIIITIPSNEPWNTETHKTDQNPPITDHKPWPFELIQVKFCFLKSPIRWLMAAKKANVSWLLDFRVRMYLKSAETRTLKKVRIKKKS